MARRLRVGEPPLAEEDNEEADEPEAPPIEQCPNLRCRRRRMCLRKARGAACAAQGAMFDALHRELLTAAKREIWVAEQLGKEIYTAPRRKRLRGLRGPDGKANALRKEIAARFRAMARAELAAEVRAREAEGVYDGHALEHELGQGEAAGFSTPEHAFEPDSPAGPTFAPPPKREPAVPRCRDLSSPPLVPFHRLT